MELGVPSYIPCCDPVQNPLNYWCKGQQTPPHPTYGFVETKQICSSSQQFLGWNLHVDNKPEAPNLQGEGQKVQNVGPGQEAPVGGLWYKLNTGFCACVTFS